MPQQDPTQIADGHEPSTSSVPPGARTQNSVSRGRATERADVRGPSSESEFDHSIRRGRKRSQAKPVEAAVVANDERASDSSPPRTMPEHINSRYVPVGRVYHFPDGSVAFRDRGRRLSTPVENTEVIRDLISIARERGWDNVVIAGSEQFRKEAWQQAQLADINVRGYRATDLDRAMLVRRMSRQRDREDSTVDLPISTAASSGRPSTQADSNRARDEQTRSDIRQEDRVYTGRLLEHGVARFRFDPSESESYFVKLETPEGDKVIWGRDLRRAVEQSLSRAHENDEVVVRQVRAKPVAINRTAQDRDDTVTQGRRGHERVNRWSVERAEFLYDRREIAKIVRNPNIDPKSGVKERPELVGTYEELHIAKRIAQKNYPNLVDRERFLRRIRESIAQEIELGQPLSAPRPRARGRGVLPDGSKNSERVHEQVLS